ncbi:hypothetical protein [Bacillus phage vB_BanS-Thrax4]|nr:hypothetical protein [Bacillus phage vB_BanS-Thrax4]
MVNYQMRIGMVMVLQEGIMQWNNNDTSMLKSTLLKINDMDGYSVRMIQEEREIDEKVYKLGDCVFEICEDDGLFGESALLFSVYRDKRDNMMVLEVYAEDLLTRNELKVDYDLKMQIIEESLVC